MQNTRLDPQKRLADALGRTADIAFTRTVYNLHGGSRARHHRGRRGVLVDRRRAVRAQASVEVRPHPARETHEERREGSEQDHCRQQKSFGEELCAEVWRTGLRKVLRWVQK